jgi:tRNA-splicing ligase RtcB
MAGRPGGVPLKMWTRGVPVEDEAKPAGANAARLPIVFKHIAAMPDVHLGIGATVGSVIPTAQGHHPGRGGRGHRLRHDRLQDHAARRRPARQPGAAALGHRARGAARPPPGSRDPGRLAEGAGRGGRAWAHAEPDSTELCRDYPRWRRPTTSQAPGHAGHRQPLHRGLPGRGRLRVVHAALGLARRGQCIGTTSSNWRKQDASAQPAQPARPRPGLLRGRQRSTSATTCARWAGRSASRRNREVMMARRVIEPRAVIREAFERMSRR